MYMNGLLDEERGRAIFNYRMNVLERICIKLRS